MIRKYVEDGLPFGPYDIECDCGILEWEFYSDVDALIDRSRMMTSHLVCCPHCDKISLLKFAGLE